MSRRDASGGRPILVTGGHRSGTTFVGKMLAVSDEVAYVHEPFNPLSVSAGGLLPPLERAYQYICSGNADAYVRRVADVTMLRFRPWRRLPHVHGAREYARAARTQFEFASARLRRQRVLLKDPLALFSAPWIHDTFGALVIVTIRHPAGFVSSLKRLGWNSFNFRHWLDQELLMRHYLAPIEDDIRALAEERGDVIDQGIVLWNGIHLAIDTMRREHPDWLFVRHEDISASPLQHFEKMYRMCGLHWSEVSREAVARTTGEANPIESTHDDPHSIEQDSAKVASLWTSRLSAGELDRILEGTRVVASRFYSSEELQSPGRRGGGRAAS